MILKHNQEAKYQSLIKIGMPTLLELSSLEDNVILCNRLGLDFVEINMNLPKYQNLSSDYLLDLQEKFSIFFTFHVPEDIDIAHLNDKIRKAYHEVIFDTIDLMKKIGSKKLNMHMSKGIHFTLPNNKVNLYEELSEEYLFNISTFRTKLDEALDGSEIRLLIENTGDFDRGYITSAVDILLESNFVELTWDIGHDYSSGKIDEHFIIERQKKLSHMHMHDAIGKSNHLELFTGEMDIDSYYDSAIKNKMDIVIETKTLCSLENSVLNFNKRYKY